MRWPLLVLPVLLAAGCGAPPEPEGTATVRLLIAGTVDLSAPAAGVAAADPEGAFRALRLEARRADLAVAAATTGAGADLVAAEGLLSAAGFDAVACPTPRALGEAVPASAPRLAVTLFCGDAPPPVGMAPAAGGSLPGLMLTIAATPSAAARFGTVTVPAAGGAPALVIAPPLMGRTGVTAFALGTLLSGDPGRGGLIEVLADSAGVIAYRVGTTTYPSFRVRFGGWEAPVGDAVLLDGEWWALARPLTPAPPQRPSGSWAFDRGDPVAAAIGDVTGDGAPDLAVSYRHPFRPSPLSDARPEAVGVDSQGRSAHLGVFTLEGEARWAAGMIPRPVGDLAACDGSLALAYTGLDDPQVAATGAAVWTGWRLRPAPELPGPGAPGCADVDGDGRLDPVILGRSG